MGLFDFLAKTKHIDFVPNFNEPEYDNWLNFIDIGGTTEEFERLKKENNWKFKKSDIEIYEEYLNEINPVSSKYFELMGKVEAWWSLLYNLNDYIGDSAKDFEKACLQNILYYKKMREIDIKYNEKTATNIPAFKRLAMLYEKQGKFEDSVAVCKEAISFGMDEKARMVRMIKKAGRTPTSEEMALIDN